MSYNVTVKYNQSLLSSGVIEDKDAKLIIRACLYTIPTSLHVVGLYFLITIKNLGTAEDQRLYLKHLSLAEIMICTFKIATHVVELADLHHTAERIWVFQTTLFFTVYILILAALTVDRFLSVYLNVKYPRYVTRKKVHATLLASWSLSALIAVLIFTLLEHNERRYFIVVYLWPTEEAIFLAIALPTYFYIFAKLRRNRAYMLSIKRHVRQLDSQQGQDIILGGAADLAQMPLKMSMMPSCSSISDSSCKKKESIPLLKWISRLKRSRKQQRRKTLETANITADVEDQTQQVELDSLLQLTSITYSMDKKNDGNNNNNNNHRGTITTDTNGNTTYNNNNRTHVRRKHGMQVHDSLPYSNSTTDYNCNLNNISKIYSSSSSSKNIKKSSNPHQYNRRGAVKSRRRSTLHRLTHTVGNSLLKRKYSYMKRNKSKRRFFIPVLLIATFIVFWIIPDLAELAVEHNGMSPIDPTIAFWINISYMLAVSSDALIYILGIPAIYRRIVRLFRRRR